MQVDLCLKHFELSFHELRETLMLLHRLCCRHIIEECFCFKYHEIFVAFFKQMKIRSLFVKLEINLFLKKIEQEEPHLERTNFANIQVTNVQHSLSLGTLAEQVD